MSQIGIIITLLIIGATVLGSVITVAIAVNNSHKRESETLRKSNTEQAYLQQRAVEVMGEIHERDSQMIRDGYEPAPVVIQNNTPIAKRLNG
jgi:hypothetical protein